MGTAWRRAFCTTHPESTLHSKSTTHSPSPSPGTCARFNFLSSPSLHHHPPSSPLSLFKNTFKFRSNCGICSNSVKTGQGTAIYTAECGHAFHFPCVLSHARSHVCPVCHATWNDVPLHQNDAVLPTVRTPNHKQLDPLSSKSLPSYDDDEPLPSSLTCFTQILPIPEADESTHQDEEENDDVPDFPGFSVLPKPQSSLRHYAETKTVRVKLMQECAVISVSQSFETRALVLRVKAPAPSPPLRRRQAMDLVAVLDVGNGMNGAKLHVLKRVMRLVISSLGAADRLAVVASSADSERLLPLRRMTAQGQRTARRVVDQVEVVCGQGSGREEVLKKAGKVLEDRREKNPLARILHLSNGNDNCKNSNQRRCLNYVSSLGFDCVEVPVYSFGFDIKKTGLTPEPFEDDFIEYINRTLSLAVQDLRIQLGFSAPAEIRAVYSCSGGPTALSVNSTRLGDLYGEEEKELLVEVRVPTSALGNHHVLTVRCFSKDPASQKFVHSAEHPFTVVPPKSSSPCGGRVERLRNVFITNRAVAESRRMVKHNEFSSAHHLLASARALLVQFGSAEEYVRGLDAELVELQWRRQHRETVGTGRSGESEREVRLVDDGGEMLTPTSAWRAAEKLAKMARMKKSLNKVSDLHGFENARF
ncbi:E3 ubiquitin-protein ligase WAV3-like [Vigna unguiculata]|uniref:E3 ubiquitin-protein ligase WAV3-like n=1 Tax=Vigna unguiculata TaxID=3917 RepID=UPI0010168A69|nr:E3 ubiquitin-protein ligase WAV3-like [Vigna unguiculata]